ncbi:hypothetical protein CALVIDRAFT_255693 [Calocera viscosa TUFC12733]|uniref:Uncharacterized protein n=1 Tax=Calocera viscosa (strain TUFC12733) TaxID=1330018 RepID=A0A167J991_CALVF|nr:hypothetical protein CALVIDRAFT_255693 [Calocera viscosa TUFC12733]
MNLSVDQHKELDALVLDKLKRYGAAQEFNAMFTLIAIVKTCGELDQSFADLDKVVDVLQQQWVLGIVEAAFHLKAFRIVRDLPMMIKEDIKIEVLEDEDEPKLPVKVSAPDNKEVEVKFEPVDKDTIMKIGDDRCDFCKLYKRYQCMRKAGYSGCEACSFHMKRCTIRPTCPADVPEDLYSDLRMLFDIQVKNGPRAVLSKVPELQGGISESYAAVWARVIDWFEFIYSERGEFSSIVASLGGDFGAFFVFQNVFHPTLRSRLEL